MLWYLNGSGTGAGFLRPFSRCSSSYGSADVLPCHLASRCSQAGSGRQVKGHGVFRPAGRLKAVGRIGCQGRTWAHRCPWLLAEGEAGCRPVYECSVIIGPGDSQMPPTCPPTHRLPFRWASADALVVGNPPCLWPSSTWWTCSKVGVCESRPAEINPTPSTVGAVYTSRSPFSIFSSAPVINV